MSPRRHWLPPIVPLDHSADFRGDGVMSVYAAYGKRSELLYIGLTQDIERRLKEHRSKRSPWWEAVAVVRVVSGLSRAEAYSLETTAIGVLEPPFNIKDMPA